MTDRALGMLGEGLAANIGIEEVQFTHNDLSLPNGAVFIAALKNMTNLKKLSLNSCNLEIERLQQLHEALIDKEKLVDLSLYSNDINAEGAKILAQTLANKTQLKTLGLSNNIIGQGGARELAQVCLPGL